MTGDAVPLVEDVAQANVTAHFAISSQGALVYVPRDAMGGPPSGNGRWCGSIVKAARSRSRGARSGVFLSTTVT